MVTASSAIPAQQQHLPIWATGPVQVARSDHFLALLRPGTDMVDQSLVIAEQARVRLLARLPLDVDTRQVLILAHDHAAFDQIAGAPQGLTNWRMPHSPSVVDSLRGATSSSTWVRPSDQVRSSSTSTN